MDLIPQSSYFIYKIRHLIEDFVLLALRNAVVLRAKSLKFLGIFSDLTEDYASVCHFLKRLHVLVRQVGFLESTWPRFLNLVHSDPL